VFLAIAGLAVLVGGIWGYRAYKASDEGGIEYQTASVTRQDLAAQVTASGTLSPLVTVEVGSQVSGRIQALHVDFNSRVTKGQVIAKIDPQLIQSDVTKARANMTAARAAVARAEAELGQARRNNQRTSALASKALVAKADADATLATLEASEAGVASAKASLTQARAALTQAETNLAYTTIVSPIDGIVISRDVNVGQTVAASLQAPKLFTIAEDLAKMEVHTSVAESDVGRLTQGMDVEFTVDAHPSDRFVGKVKEVRYSPQTVQNVVTYDAVVSVDNAELKLRPGMTADVTFLIEKRDDAIVVPNAALRFRPPPDVLAQIGFKGPPEGARTGGAARTRGERTGGGGEQTATAGTAPRSEILSGDAPRGEGRRGRGGAERANRRMVWKMGATGLPEPARVTIGISDGRQTEIVDGLAEGDRIITGITGAQAAPAEQNQQGGGNRGGGNRRPRSFL
jgi:HlyD family secretion protein